MALLFSRAEPFVQFLVEGIMRNNSVNLFRIWVTGLGGDVVYKISYLELWWISYLELKESSPMYCHSSNNNLKPFKSPHFQIIPKKGKPLISNNTAIRLA